ncbi:MAG TPA: PxKF domain-containing protein, partial [Blastocatellia bacterium]|nr:PxKF domain-containing protein [Blastocatellia bacterium]
LAATTNLNDNCDPLNAGNTVTKSVETSAAVACSTSVVVRVQDSCGNFTDYTYNTRVDGTAPTAAQGSIAACYQTVAAANGAALAATTALTDNCDPSPTKAVQTSAIVACNTSVVIRVQDSCGNSTDYTYPTRIDGTAPTATQGSVAACYQTVAAANAGALAATTNLNDNCDPLNAGNTVTKSVQTSAAVACSTSVVIRVQDSCGTFTDYTYNTRVDGTAPTATQGSIAACYQTVAAANGAALAATTALTDNCDPSPTKAVQTSATVACSTSVVIRVQDSCGDSTDYTYNTRVDSTPPVITCPGNVTTSCSGSSGGVVTYASPTATDNCGGTPTVSCAPPSGSPFPIGATTVNCTATDSCNNSSSCSFTVSVSYTFIGFFQPVDNPPETNAVKAGQSVPLKFQLKCGSSFISDLSAVLSVQSANVACGSEDPDPPLPADDSGSSGLHYDYVANQFVFSWKTEKQWANSCRVFILTLRDGSQHLAYFQFKK